MLVLEREKYEKYWDEDGRWMQEDGSNESPENRYLFLILRSYQFLSEGKKEYSAEQ
ncbi:hypothetical protein [Chryseobacterium indologenes]|uniref:hypothetical protein n=1 Tax=Chryseobacterium indologenes TaxID=253 RepID=UPI000AE90313|nr:hypothetical protein [Chryseobacterium indologenes]